MSLSARFDDVRRRIEAAARASGRDPSEVRLIAVSKKQPAERALELYDLGVRDFGENTAQGLLEKTAAFVHAGKKARWHFIGRLQRNKVKQVLPTVDVVHSVDRLELALELSRRAQEGELAVLVQVNLGREPQKGGVDPDAAVAFAREVALMPGLRLLGLMGIPPVDTCSRPYFEALRELSALLRATPEGAAASELSMGMTDDYESAIAAGSTMVRVGTAIFGARERTRSEA